MDGWLSPDGIFYDTQEIVTHIELAYEIIELNNINKRFDILTNTYADGERLLEILGYIKLVIEYEELVEEWRDEFSLFLPNGIDGMTNKQFNWLYNNWEELSSEQQRILKFK